MVKHRTHQRQGHPIPFPINLPTTIPPHCSNPNPNPYPLPNDYLIHIVYHKSYSICTPWQTNACAHNYLLTRSMSIFLALSTCTGFKRTLYLASRAVAASIKELCPSVPGAVYLTNHRLSSACNLCTTPEKPSIAFICSNTEYSI